MKNSKSVFPRNLRYPAIVFYCIGIVCLFFYLSFLIGEVKKGYGSRDCETNLEIIGRGLRSYHYVQKSFPPQINMSQAQTHSWRVAILPFILDYKKKIVNKYHFDQPWNSPDNLSLGYPDLAKNSIYHCPKDPAEQVQTSYVAVVGSKTMFRTHKSLSYADIPGSQAVEEKGHYKISGNASYKAVVVEMHNSGIHWMEPRDLSYDDALKGINSGSKPGISSSHTYWIDRTTGSGSPVLFADGSVHFLSSKTDPKNLQILFEIEDKDKLPEKVREK